MPRGIFSRWRVVEAFSVLQPGAINLNGNFDLPYVFTWTRKHNFPKNCRFWWSNFLEIWCFWTPNFGKIWSVWWLGASNFREKICHFLYEFSAKIGSPGKVGNVQFLENIGYFEDLEFCGKIPDVDSLIAKVPSSWWMSLRPGLCAVLLFLHYGFHFDFAAKLQAVSSCCPTSVASTSLWSPLSFSPSATRDLEILEIAPLPRSCFPCSLERSDETAAAECPRCRLGTLDLHPMWTQQWTLCRVLWRCGAPWTAEVYAYAPTTGPWPQQQPWADAADGSQTPRGGRPRRPSQTRRDRGKGGKAPAAKAKAEGKGQEQQEGKGAHGTKGSKGKGAKGKQAEPAWTSPVTAPAQTTPAPTPPGPLHIFGTNQLAMLLEIPTYSLVCQNNIAVTTR